MVQGFMDLICQQSQRGEIPAGSGLCQLLESLECFPAVRWTQVQGDALERTLITVPCGERLDQLLAESASFPNRFLLDGFLLSGLFPTGHFTISGLTQERQDAQDFQDKTHSYARKYPVDPVYPVRYCCGSGKVAGGRLESIHQ